MIVPILVNLVPLARTVVKISLTQACTFAQNRMNINRYPSRVLGNDKEPLFPFTLSVSKGEVSRTTMVRLVPIRQSEQAHHDGSTGSP